MTLQTFVEDTLVELVTAVKNAAERTKALGAKINPTLPDGGDVNVAAERLKLFRSWNGELGDMIEFDLAITAAGVSAQADTTTGGGKLGGNIHVVAASIGGEKQSESRSELQNAQISRVKFRIPVVLPHLAKPI